MLTDLALFDFRSRKNHLVICVNSFEKQWNKCKTFTDSSGHCYFVSFNCQLNSSIIKQEFDQCMWNNILTNIMLMTRWPGKQWHSAWVQPVLIEVSSFHMLWYLFISNSLSSDHLMITSFGDISCGLSCPFLPVYFHINLA